MMKRLLALLLLLPAVAAATTNHYNIGDQTNITGGTFSSSTISGPTTFPSLDASKLLMLNSSRILTSFGGTSGCTNQAIYSLSAAGVESCTSTFASGGHTGMTALGLRSSGSGAFDVTLANTENLTAARTLTLRLNDAARTLNLGGNLVLGGAFTTAGSSALTFTTTGATGLILPTTGTLSTLAGSEALTNKTFNGNTWTAGTGTLTLGAGKTLTNSNTLTFTGTDGSAVAFGTGGSVLYSTGGTGITTVGTVTTGTWNATPVAAQYGGTGNSSYAIGDLLYASGATTLSKLADVATGSALISGGVGIAPAWGKIAPGTLATQATNTILGNATSGTASPTALAVGSCSAAGSALTWTTNTGFGCATTLLTSGGALGTPSSGTLTSATGLPISTGLTGAGTGVLTALGVNVGSAGAFTTFSGAHGTPSSITLTNGTGLPISSGVSGLGTGIATALAINTGSAGAPVLLNGALGTPSSGVATNLTGTAAGLTAGAATTAVTLTAPAFMARPTAAALDQTGDGTAYTINWGTEYFDSGNELSGTTWTSAAGGKYRCTVRVSLDGLLSGHTIQAMSLALSTGTTLSDDNRYTSANPFSSRGLSIDAEVAMTAGATGTVSVTVSGSTKVVDIQGSGLSWFGCRQLGT